MSLESVKLIQLPKILDDRGNLSFFENNAQIPFAIARVYWVYDVPGGEMRGGHAYKRNSELIVALSGSFDVFVNDGKSEIKYSLNRSYVGLYIPNMLWREVKNFSTNALALVAADTSYLEEDYIRDFNYYSEQSQNAP